VMIVIIKSHRWKTVYQSDANGQEYISFCDDCGAEYAGEFTENDQCSNVEITTFGLLA
jgi:hypothetical protein